MNMLRTPEAALDEALAYLHTEVAPNAQSIDQDTEALRVALQGLCKRDLMAMRRPVEYGGPDISDEQFKTFQEELARTSGALAFLQTQHQSAVTMIARSGNEGLKAEYLPQMGDGRKLVGIGFSQLRRPGDPLVKAEPVEGGYMITGHVPWVTGWDLYEEFLLGAYLPDGRSLFCIAPLRSGRGVTVSPTMQLAAMGSANTVTLDFDGYFLPDTRAAFIREQGWIHKNDTINIAQSQFAFGCAQAAIDVVRDASARRPGAFLLVAADELQAELERCKLVNLAAQSMSADSMIPQRLDARAWAIELAVRASHAAIAASAGAANYLSNPAQRIYREALVYTVSAQTTQIMEATLKRLVRV